MFLPRVPLVSVSLMVCSAEQHFSAAQACIVPSTLSSSTGNPESDKSAVCGFGGRCKPQPWGYQRQNYPCQLHTLYIFQSSSIFISCSSCSSFRQSNSARHLTAFHSQEIYFQGTMILQIFYLLPLNVTNNIGIPSYHHNECVLS